SLTSRCVPERFRGTAAADCERAHQQSGGMSHPVAAIRCGNDRDSTMGIFTAGLLLSLQVAQTATPVTDSVERAALTQDADTVHRVDYVGQEKTYSSPALAAIVRAAAELNRNAPAALTGYRARVTSEIAMVTRREDGTEAVMAIEQLASAVRWQRPGTFDQDVIGYRSQAIGPNLSALTFMDRPWLVPSLYGNRLALFFGRDTSERGERRRRRAEERRERAGRPPVLAVHPLADDREAVYRYSGGDTIATVRVSGRSIPIVRVYVEPREDLDRRRFVFRGEMDLDVSRHELVRMRGQLLAMDERLTLRERVGRIVAEPIAYVELENQELQGRYWSPARQRVELPVAVPRAGDSRGIMRVVSHFREVELQLDRTLVQADSQRQLPHAPDDSAGASGRTRADAAPDSLQPAPFTLRVAGADTLAEFDDWPRMIGDATAGLRADDFDDVAPERYRSTGEPRLEFGVNRASDVAHFNRVEGLYTGAGDRKST